MGGRREIRTNLEVRKKGGPENRKVKKRGGNAIRPFGYKTPWIAQKGGGIEANVYSNLGSQRLTVLNLAI